MRIEKCIISKSVCQLIFQLIKISHTYYGVNNIPIVDILDSDSSIYRLVLVFILKSTQIAINSFAELDIYSFKLQYLFIILYLQNDFNFELVVREILQ